jgi:hypothetical protein
VRHDGYQVDEVAAEVLIHEADTYHMARGRGCHEAGARGGDRLPGVRHQD